PLAIHVQPTHDERRLVITEELDLNERDIEILGQDIRPVREGHAPLRSGNRRAIPLTAAVALAPLALYGATALAVRRRQSDGAIVHHHHDAPATMAEAL